MNDKYLAGLWFSAPYYGLCWHFQHTPHEIVFDLPAGAKFDRPVSWRAPYWHFMSVEGLIIFKSEKNLDFRPRELGSDPDCTILSCRVVPLSKEAPFGRLASRILKVRGRLFQVERTSPWIFKIISILHAKPDVRASQTGIAAGQRKHVNLMMEGNSQKSLKRDFTPLIS